MSKQDEMRPRKYIELSQDNFLKLGKLVPHGQWQPLMEVVVEDLISALEDHGDTLIALLVTRRLGLEHVVRILKDVKDANVRDAND